MPSFALYYGDITPLREPRPGEVVFTRVDRFDQLDTPTEILFQRGGVLLARALESSSTQVPSGARPPGRPGESAEQPPASVEAAGSDVGGRDGL
jgi:hypothetical protein